MGGGERLTPGRRYPSEASSIERVEQGGPRGAGGGGGLTGPLTEMGSGAMRRAAMETATGQAYGAVGEPLLGDEERLGRMRAR